MKVFVIGAGRMGAIIASEFLKNGHEVWLNDTIKAAVDSGAKKIKRLLEKEFTEEQTTQFLSNLHRVTDYSEVATVDLIIESIFEDLELKKEVFFELDELVSDTTIIASNTATLSISELASGLEHQSQVCGFHFYSVFSSFELIEIIPGAFTDSSIVEKLKEISMNLGKKPIVCTETPGFIVNRLLVNMINDACNMLMEGVASAEDIDNAIQMALGCEYGPLHLSDKMGNDMSLLIIENIFKETGDSRYRPSPYLRKMVRANLLGVKTRAGFFSYDNLPPLPSKK